MATIRGGSSSGSTPHTKGLNGKAGIAVILAWVVAVQGVVTYFVTPGILRAARQDAEFLMDRHTIDRDRYLGAREQNVLQRLDAFQSLMDQRLTRIEEKIK